MISPIFQSYVSLPPLPCLNFQNSEYISGSSRQLISISVTTPPCFPLFYSKLTSLDAFHLLSCPHSLVIFQNFEIFYQLMTTSYSYFILWVYTYLHSFTDILMGFWMEENINRCARLAIFIGNSCSFLKVRLYDLKFLDAYSVLIYSWIICKPVFSVDIFNISFSVCPFFGYVLKIRRYNSKSNIFLIPLRCKLLQMFIFAL